MPSQPNAVLGAKGARQLLRRTTFAPTPAAVASYAPLTRQAAAAKLANYTPSKFRPNNKDIQIAHGKWVKYMLRTNLQLQEKLVLFLHDHFATGNDKVQYPAAMSLQNRTLRQFSNGNFKDLVKAINKDPAMIEYLDTARNRKSVPNENYARELQELFTLGVFDLNGKANYKQEDIVQIARAFTGWRYDYKKLTPYLNDGQHDYQTDFLMERGPKQIYGTARDDGPGNVGGFVSPQTFGADPGPPAEGEAEIDTVIDIIFQHKDSDGASTVARFLTKKLLSYFCFDGASKTLIDEVIADSNFATDAHVNQWNLGALLKAIFVNDAFYDTAAEPDPVTGYGGSEKKSIKWPIDYVVSTIRLLNMKLKSKYPYVVDANEDVYDTLGNMGQLLFDPPSVFGWDWENSWISSTTLLARFGFSRDIISARDGAGRLAFRPEKLIDTSLTDGGSIVAAVLDALGMTDLFTDAESDALIDYVTDGSPATPVDLTDVTVRNTKLHGLFGLILESPHYQVQ